MLQLSSNVIVKTYPRAKSLFFFSLYFSPRAAYEARRIIQRSSNSLERERERERESNYYSQRRPESGAQPLRTICHCSVPRSRAELLLFLRGGYLQKQGGTSQKLRIYIYIYIYIYTYMYIEREI